MSFPSIALKNHPNPKELINAAIQRDILRVTRSNRHVEANLKDFDLSVQKKVKKALRQNLGLLVTGKTGTGKTHMLTAVIREIAENRFKENLIMVGEITEKKQLYVSGHCFMTSSHDINTDIKGIYSDEERTVEDLIDEYTAGSPHLFIDDMGTEKQTEHTNDLWDAIINGRWVLDKGVATYVSTNFNFSKLQKLYGSRIASRLKDMCVVIEMKGKDRRG